MKITNFLIVIIFFLNSCAPVMHHKRESQSVVYQQKTDTVFIETVKAIKDTFFIAVPQIKTPKKECDTLCQTELQRVLFQLNTHKKSGESQAGIYYDKYKNLLVAYNHLAQSQSEKKSHQAQTQIIQTQEVIKEVPVRYVPKFIKFLALSGAVVWGLLILALSLWFASKMNIIKQIFNK